MTVELAAASKWYGNVVAVNDVSFTLGPGVTGLLGPNGAGKSTILHMIVGLLQPSSGEVKVGGTASWQHPEIYRTLGFVPESEGVYAFLTGYEFVLLNARLQGVADPAAAATRAIALVELEQAQHRPISTYSKGMRQRAKIASVLAHDPAVLLLDEPFNGMDPKQRVQMMTLLRRFADEGRTVLVSSHILEEVDRLADTVLVVIGGRLAASGPSRVIRQLMTDPTAHVHGTEQRRSRPRSGDRPGICHDRGLVHPGGDEHPHGGSRCLHPRPAGAGAQRQRVDPRGASDGRITRERLLLPGAGVAVLINAAIAGLTVRQSLAKRRWIIVAVLAVLPILMALITRVYAGDDAPVTMTVQILSTLSVTVVVPVIALILANSGFGAEVDDGTVVYLLCKPISRVTIVATKLLVTSSICIVTAVISTLAAGAIGVHGFDKTRLVIGFTVAVALGSFLYTAIFLALGLITRRGMLIGLVYLVVWEGTAGTLFPGTRSLSVRQYMLSVTDAISTVDPISYLSQVPHATAYQMSVIVAVAAVALCVYRLRTFQVGQSS